MFEKFLARKRAAEEEQRSDDPLLMNIAKDLNENSEVRDYIAEQILGTHQEQFKSLKEIKKLFNPKDSTEALGLARLIDETFGSGSFRTLSFVSESADANKNVLRILQKNIRNIEKESFEGRAEKGLYLGIMENYDVQWSMEKAARDAWQNFFDANDQNLDGVEHKTRVDEEQQITTIEIRGDKDYDWRELVHLGATTKKDSDKSAGGFGEGTKVLALVMLRDYDADEVRFASGSWELEFYLDDVPEQSYHSKTQGLFVKKKTLSKPVSGNRFEVQFEGEEAVEKVEKFEEARELFYSSENEDFKDATFNNPETGGFKVLPPKERKIGKEDQDGNLYIAGQRMHYNSRDEWNTVDNINIWTWKKIVQKDRDRGLVTRQELEKEVIPFIVDSMSKKELINSVYEFHSLWDRSWSHEASYKTLSEIVDRLSDMGVELEFEEDYLAGQAGFPLWISRLLREKGYRICPSFMEKIGMRTVGDKFKEMQSHIRVEATPEENQKIALLREIADELGLESDEIKPVWIYGAGDERNIFHGQYSPEFYWMAREAMAQNLLDVVHTYVHEAAHREGPHGDPKFEYRLQELIKRIQKFIMEEPERFREYESQWGN